jgi:lysyl-tRNA synthetase, class II
MNEPTPQQTTSSEAALEAARREKLRKIREMGIDPWGSRFDGHQPIGQIRAREAEITVEPAGDCQTGHPPEQHGPKVRAAGRIVLRRPSGKVHWLQVRDWTGTIQVMIGKAQVGDENFALAQCLDLGDMVGVDGELKRTKTGELTIFAEDLKLLTKSLVTPPEKHKGLADPELRQRMRYLDLIHTDGVLERFLRRTRIVQSIRNTLSGRSFVEVEGPTLHAIAGGAAARPFTTHHNALDIDLYLRIALELHLKRLLVGGIERVFELGRVYRNEGIDARHNPEFTMLEVYQAYGNYETMMELTEAVIVDAIRATGQGMKLPWGDVEIDFTPPFARRTYDELFAEHTGIRADDATGIAKLAERLGFNAGGKHPDVVKSFVFEQQVEDALRGPIFVLDYPASICPLTKRKTSDPAVAERFELFIQGMEVANAYTELNDPDLQEELLTHQLAGLPEEESMAKMDRDFIRALRNGMPPAGGLGIGIDRLVMLLTNSQTIREVILFPLLRPEAEGKAEGKAEGGRGKAEEEGLAASAASGQQISNPKSQIRNP